MGLSLGSLKVFLKTDDTEFRRGLDQAETTSKSWAGRIGGFLSNSFSFAIGGLINQGINTITNSIGGLVSGMIDGNAEFERYQTQFGVLLGSADAAKERLEALAEFGATTPFDLPEVVKADKILQGFGIHSEDAAKKWGFAGEDIRRIAGDVAAGTGAAFTDIAGYLGKFSAGSTGEVISRFQELGIVTRAQMAEMGIQFSKSGEMMTPVDEAFGILLESMQGKYGGMMDAQSKTFEGMTSNLRDWAGQTLRTLGQPIFEVAKDKLGKLLEFLGSAPVQGAITGLAAGLGDLAGKAVAFVESMAKGGDFGFLGKIGPIFETISAKGKSVYDWVQTYIPPIIDAGGKLFEKVATGAGGIGDEVLPWLVEKLDRIGAWFVENGPLIQAYTVTLIEFVGAALEFVGARLIESWAVAEPILNGLLEIVMRVAETVMKLVTGDWQGAWDSFSQIPQLALSGLGQAFDNLGNIVAGWLGADWETVKATWRGNWDMLGVIVERVPIVVGEKLAGIGPAIRTKLDEVRAALVDRMRGLAEALGLDWDGMSARWSKIWDDIVLIGGTLATRAVEAVSKEIAKVSQPISEKATEVSGAWSSIWKTLETLLPAAWDAIVGALRTQAGKITAPITEGITAARTEVDKIVAGFEDVGGSMIDGLIKGIGKGLGKLIDAITGAIEDALTAAKKKLGIQSPSREFLKLGISSMEGMAAGFSRGSAAPQAQLAKAMDKLTSAAASFTRGVQPAVAPAGSTTWAPVYNVSGMSATEWAYAQTRREQLAAMRRKL